MRAGDRVLILSENRPEWGVADLAIQSIGAWTVPLYPSLSAQDITIICRDCEPVVCVASSIEHANALLDVCRTLTSIRAIVVLEPMPQPSPQTVAWSAALAQGRDAESSMGAMLQQRLAQAQPDHTATLIYTSGTTGEPKGVMLSHRNFLSNVDACLQVVSVTSHDSHLSFLPLCHVFERMAGWYLMLAAGASVAYAESMDTIPQNMLETHPTVMLGMPRFFEKLYTRIQDALQQAAPLKRRFIAWALAVGRSASALQLAGRPLPTWLTLQRFIADRLMFAQLRARLGGRLRFFISGSAPLSKEIGEFFYSVGVTILEGYGLTETSPVIAVNRPGRLRFGSVGELVPGVEVRIAEDGEVLTRGPHVMQSYYRKPDVTAFAIVEGWFHTGDIGRLEDGFLYITDRKKDLIKTSGGKFVAPQKLENLFLADPCISQAFVYGDKRPYCVALIVPDASRLRRYALEQEIPGRSVGELVRDARIQAFYWGRVQAAQAALAGFEHVKKIALLDQEFSQAAGELTPTLKAKRSIIAQRHDALLQSLYQPSGS